MWFIRNVGWYTWPLWPFALWTLYSWRSFWRRPHVLLPMLITASSIVALLVVADPSDRELIAGVPGLVVLGAFSVSTLRRAADNAIDWFSLVLFTLALLAVWIYFGAWNAGVPPKMAASVSRLVPGLEASVPLVATRDCARRDRRVARTCIVESAAATKDAVARAIFCRRWIGRCVGGRRLDLRCPDRVLALVRVHRSCAGCAG